MGCTFEGISKGKKKIIREKKKKKRKKIKEGEGANPSPINSTGSSPRALLVRGETYLFFVIIIVLLFHMSIS